MPEKRKANSGSSRVTDRKRENTNETLEDLNSRLRRRRKGPALIRHSMEAALERNSQKRRRGESSASSAWKKA